MVVGSCCSGCFLLWSRSQSFLVASCSHSALAVAAGWETTRSKQQCWWQWQCTVMTCSAAVRKVINLPAADIPGTEFYTNLRRKTPHLLLTMADSALDGTPIQPTTHPPNVNAIPVVMNGIHKCVNKHWFIPNCFSCSHSTSGTSSYAVPCRKPRPTGTTQWTHHDDTSHNTRILPKLQKNQALSEQPELINYSTTLLHDQQTAWTSHHPIPANHNFKDRPHGPNLRLTPYRPPKMRKSTSPTTQNHPVPTQQRTYPPS